MPAGFVFLTSLNLPIRFVSQYLNALPFALLVILVT
jgi:hypothetical protein